MEGSAKFRWKQVPRQAMVAEAAQMLLALVAIALGWLSFPLLYRWSASKSCW